MELVLKRIAKMDGYTIGRLYILADDEVKKSVSLAANENLKRVFVRDFDVEMLDKQHYFCDTLEPTWRNLLGIALKPLDENERLGRISGKKAQKMKGCTAIPEGTYALVVTKSWRFAAWLPLLLGVPGFSGIRIHVGNEPKHTQGCILVGENKKKGMVLNSRIWLHRLMERIQEARERDEGIWITII